MDMTCLSISLYLGVQGMGQLTSWLEMIRLGRCKVLTDRERELHDDISLLSLS